MVWPTGSHGTLPHVCVCVCVCVCVQECMLSLPYIAQSYPAAPPGHREIRPQTHTHTHTLTHTLCPSFLCCDLTTNTRTPSLLPSPSAHGSERTKWTGPTSTLLRTGPSCLPPSPWERGTPVSRGLPLRQQRWFSCVRHFYVSLIIDDFEECAESWALHGGSVPEKVVWGAAQLRFTV